MNFFILRKIVLDFHRLQLQPRRWDIRIHRQCITLLKTINIQSGEVNTLYE
jgi:hypothetical protein